jgi:2-keto-4-pentenoate hydratase/2-oxohepta-3-ene-1,7-dioic acid hydratase in catechol pathway
MRLGRYSTPQTEQPWCGAALDDQTVVNLSKAGTAAGIDIPVELGALLAEWNWEEKTELVIEFARENSVAIHERDALERHQPVAAPEKVVCVGLNYADHAEEGDNELPDRPKLFSKFPTTISGPGDDITWDPTYTETVDYEGELVVVIGKEARNVDVDDADDYIAGLTVGNDVSARDIQHGDGQWVRGKSLDTFGPTGPDLVTLDEIADYHDLSIWTEVNGERLQDSTTANLIFGLDEIVAFCSRAFTLTPGDLIFTGTPPGVGVYRDPQVLLDDGDTVTVGIEDLGELTNPCRTHE